MVGNIYNLIGPVGTVIVIVGVIAILIAMYSIIYTRLVWKQFCREFFHAKDKSAKHLKEYTGINPFMIIIREVISTHAYHSDDLRAEIGYLFYRNFRRISNYITWLKMLAVITPLLGLLGTVLGMLQVFQVVSLDAAPNPQLLAEGIWQALVTTVLGLVVAIPTMIIFYLLSLRMKGFHVETIEHCYRYIDIAKKEL